MLRTLLAAVLAAACCTAAGTPKITRVEPPRHVLFVGDSFCYYNESLHAHLRKLVESADPDHAKGYIFKSVTISGGFLDQHAGDLPYMLRYRNWDVVVLQGQSTEAMASDTKHVARFRDTARGFDGMIRSYGAKTAFFMTWAYEGKPEMTDALAEGYEGIGNELDDLVVPVGLAFRNSLAKRPELILHFKDHMHPSMAGTYLAA